MSAGWNMTQGRAAANATAFNAAGAGNAVADNEINNYWNDPASAGNWIRFVVGDIESSTTNGGTRDTFAGLGLGYELRGTVDGVQINLTDLVAGTTNPTEANLRAVSAPGVAITRHVVEAIRRQSVFEQPATISRLSGEIAMARVLDEALLARQLLTTGKQEPNIMASGLAAKVIDPAIKRLDEAIENVMFESKLRQTVVSDTVLKIIDHDEANLKRSVATPTSTDSDPKPLGTGGVVR
jgi:integrating conjugative element protein (TIGR03755 family)